MTRINLISPSELTRNHLIAEYRELPSIFGKILAAQHKGETPESIRKRAPATYVMGTGHMLFFYDKVKWLTRRYRSLVSEMLFRGYEPQYRDVPAAAFELRDAWRNDWSPSPEEIAISRARIDERLSSRVTYKNKPGERKGSTRQEWDFI